MCRSAAVNPGVPPVRTLRRGRAGTRSRRDLVTAFLRLGPSLAPEFGPEAGGEPHGGFDLDLLRIETLSTFRPREPRPAGRGYGPPPTAESSAMPQDAAANANSFAAGSGDKDFMASTTTMYGTVGLPVAQVGTPSAGDGPFDPGNRCMISEGS